MRNWADIRPTPHEKPRLGRGPNTGGSICSSAFGVAQWGSEFLITASHCFDLGQNVWSGGGVYYIGPIVGWQRRNDAASIGPTDAWSGVWTSNDSWTRYRDSAWTYNGQEVCQSGVATNYTCGIWTVDPGASWDFGDGNIIVGVRACAPSGFTAARGGDSGGPVYNWHADGRLQSRGIVSGFSQANLWDASGRAIGGQCLLFTETRRMLTEWSAGTAPVTLLTS